MINNLVNTGSEKPSWYKCPSADTPQSKRQAWFSGRYLKELLVGRDAKRCVLSLFLATLVHWSTLSDNSEKTPRGDSRPVYVCKKPNAMEIGCREKTEGWIEHSGEALWVVGMGGGGGGGGGGMAKGRILL